MIYIFILILLMSYYDKYIKYKKKYLNRKLNNQKGGSNNDLWIEENFFSKTDFEEIINYTKKLKLKDDTRTSSRLTLCLNPKEHSKLYTIIYKNDKFINFIKSIKDKNMNIKLNPSYPIEYRKYFTGSNGMSWHIDTSLFEPDAFEVVLTLTNTSDSKFLWEENNIEKSINPKPNTIAIVRPTSVMHKVTPVTYGERTILKFIIEFVEKGKKDNVKKYMFNEELNKCPF